MNIKSLFFSIIFLLLFISCENDNPDNNLTENYMTKLNEIPQKNWDRLSRKKIYFGHQSVGYNMIDGMQTILKENPNIKLNIKKGKDQILFNSPVFAHDNNGANRDPKSKIDGFCKTIENNLGDKVDIAGFKFCYVDFEKGTDVDKVFKYYKERMEELSLKYPNITFIHYTVPLKSLQSGPKGFLKKLLGKDIGIEDNIVRNKFNDLLRKEYQNQNIFDIAKYESTYADGKRSFSEVNGEKVYTMVPAYTNDGGHLSSTEKIVVGSEFISFLALLKAK